MKRPLIVFGLTEMAQLAHLYFSKDSTYEVIAFTVDFEYIKGATAYCGLPIVPFESVAETYPPGKTKSLLLSLIQKSMLFVRKNTLQQKRWAINLQLSFIPAPPF